MSDVVRLPDAAARLRALTDFGSTLVVEAAAGTGKTSLLSGRIALLLASGVDPAAIVGITFTELAAHELAARVRETIDLLLAGQIPRALRVALPAGLSEGQRDALEDAVARLDCLTTTTIHGFCQELVRCYAIEADIDPGAQVVDADAADLAFAQVFDAWLARRLNAEPQADDVIATLARHDPRGTTETLRKLARFKLEHRRAAALSPDLGGRPDLELSDAVDQFRRCLASGVASDAATTLLGELETLDRHFAGKFSNDPDFATLWSLAAPPRCTCMRRNSFALIRPGYLVRAAQTKDAPASAATLLEAFDTVERCYRVILGKVSTAVIAALSRELDDVLADYARYKRAAALLDFDDLLERAASLLSSHREVRAAAAGRYSHLLVDEFQDTDPLQCDIIFRLTSDGDAADWQALTPRAGALFLVGDPKQAIYQFRGAQVETYEAAKALVLRAFPDNLLELVANFRSSKGVLDYVNATFSAPFAEAYQPNYVPLAATREDTPAGVAATKLTIDFGPNRPRSTMQDDEAAAVARLCRTILGQPLVGNGDGGARAVTPGDIALLVPTRNDLWRYEQALHRAGLPFAAQAGQALFRRQEAQDLVALVRVLADARDTAAFGALIRGPLIGLTDEQLLDIADALPLREGARQQLRVTTPPEQIADPLAREAITQLAQLRRRARFTSPVQLLHEALEKLGVRVTLALRDPDATASANANIDAILARAASYGVRGLRRFAADLTADWQREAVALEGRAEADDDRITLVTMHSCKGLEWPIVIPINAMVQIWPMREFVHRPSDNSLHWMLGDVVPPDLELAIQTASDNHRREAARLWYVATTRAKDLLILPYHPHADQRAWARVVNLQAERLPEFALAAPVTPPAPPVGAPTNEQDADRFAREAQTIAAAAPVVQWVRPSAHDTDRALHVEAIAEDLPDEWDVLELAGGRERGLVLHKLIEEVLSENLAATLEILMARAAILAAQLIAPEVEDPGLPDPAALAETVIATLELPEIAALRSRLVAEFPIYALTDPGIGRAPMAGRADAVALGDEGEIEIVIDWKSDIAPEARAMADHVDQITSYLLATGAMRGAIVYMSLGFVRWVDRPPNATP